MSQQQDDGFAWSSEEQNQFMVSVCCPIRSVKSVLLFSVASSVGYGGCGECNTRLRKDAPGLPWLVKRARLRISAYSIAAMTQLYQSYKQEFNFTFELPACLQNWP